MAEYKQGIMFGLKNERMAASPLKDLVAFNKKLKSTDNKVNSLFFWGSIAVSWSFIVIMIILISHYFNYVHAYKPGLPCVMAIIFTGYVYILIKLWQQIKRPVNSTLSPVKDALVYWRRRMAYQLKLTGVYMFTYTLIIITAIAFFCVANPLGYLFVLRITAPVSIMIYAGGAAYFIKFNRLIKNLNKAIGSIITTEN
jgi:hypothetical protein